jgi:hypothetical protein
MSAFPSLAESVGSNVSQRSLPGPLRTCNLRIAGGGTKKITQSSYRVGECLRGAKPAQKWGHAKPQQVCFSHRPFKKAVPPELRGHG